MSLFGIISLRNLYLPYVLVVLDFVMGGPQAAIQSLTGLITGHMWYFLEFSQGEGARGTVLGRAPRWLKKWLGDEDEVRPPGGSNAAAHVSRAPVTTPYGTAIPPRRREQPAGSESGHSWTGTGQRLGTE
jgi:Derlin-2/3